MKKIFVVLIVITILPILGLAQTQSAKRGMGVDNNKASVQGLKALSAGASWYYNWSHATIANFEETNLAYVPMTWNGGFNETGLRNFLAAHPSIEYLLAFNEPNFRDQANLTPSQAAAIWPRLEAIANDFDLKLVSPAVNWCGWCVEENGTTYNDPYQYLEDFFAACPECRVDYVAVHFYMGDLEAVKGSLERLWNQFHKPIWFTEFNMDKNGMGDNGTVDEQRAFMVQVLDYLEQADYVHRYAWFLARGGILTDLLKTPDELSMLGNIYANMSSYDHSFWHQTNRRIEAEHYIQMQNLSLVESTDINGNLSVGYTQTGSTLHYQVEIPAEGNYYVQFRVASEQPTVINIITTGQQPTIIDIPHTGGWTMWQTITLPVHFLAGKQTIKMEFTSGSCDINWWSINSHSSEVTYIDDSEVKAVRYYDLLGREIEKPDRDICIEQTELTNGCYTTKTIINSK